MHSSRYAVSIAMTFAALLGALACARGQTPPGRPAVANDWLARWEKNILADSGNRYCDKETGEEIGWLVSPFEEGYAYGYAATGDTKWIDRLFDWADSWIKRGVKEPDGFLGWPKDDGTSTGVVPGLYTDNMLGDAMGFRPIVQASAVILKSPALEAKYGGKARGYLKLAEQTFKKWDSRGCWRPVTVGGVWVVPEFGIDRQTGQWTAGYARKGTDGFTLPANKQNLIALWMLALYDATKKPVYRERAEKWFEQMKSRMRSTHDGKYLEWNYWDPAGPWDHKSDGSTRHWVGVHPNGGYYQIDLEGIAAAYEHGLVFTRKDIDRLIATNRDYMWNRQVENAKFQSIGGIAADDRWKDSPGVLWIALTPYDPTLRKVFEANHNPAGWGGLSATPWYVARMSGKL